MSDELVDKDKVTILEGDPVSDFWLKGAVNRYPGYTFQAKVYDVGSVFGIGQGRISNEDADFLIMKGWTGASLSRDRALGVRLPHGLRPGYGATPGAAPSLPRRRPWGCLRP